jgi:hypothetical protein
VAVVALAWGVPEKHLVIKQVNEGCNRNVVVPEDDVVWKQDGAGCNRYVGVPVEVVLSKEVGAGCYRAYGGSEEDVVAKHDGAKRIRRTWPQECQPWGLLEDVGPPPVK